jgi:NitT/TauT family transport system substrate-binding protein
MKTSRIFKVAALLPLFMVLVAGCSRNPPEKIEKIVLGAETVPHSSPVWIAENKGYFRGQGLEVEIKEFESGRTALRSMLNAEGIDIATAAQTPVVLNSFSRNDYAIVAGMVYSDNDIKCLPGRTGISAKQTSKARPLE